MQNWEENLGNCWKLKKRLGWISAFHLPAIPSDNSPHMQPSPSHTKGWPRAWRVGWFIPCTNWKRRISQAARMIRIWLVVWTPLKNISQLGWLFPIYGKIKNVPNHQPGMYPQHDSYISKMWKNPMKNQQFCEDAKRDVCCFITPLN